MNDNSGSIGIDRKFDKNGLTIWQDLIPNLANKYVLPIIIAANVGIKSCRYATECASFVHVWM